MKSDYSRDIYRQLEECFTLIGELRQELKEQKLAHEREIAKLKEAHRKEKEALLARIAELEAENAALRKENAELKAEIERLKSIINNNSSNSSNPPSSDQKPVNKYNSRTKSEKKPGGQKGHKGTTLSAADVEKLLARDDCLHSIEHIGNISNDYVVRYVVDTKVIPTVREIRIYRDENGKYQIPEKYRAPVTYGTNIKSAVYWLYGLGMIAIDRISEVIEALTHGMYKLSAGTVYGFCRGFAAQLPERVNELSEYLRNQSVIYTDATTVNVDKKQCYIRNFSTDDTVLYIGMKNKNREALDGIELLGNFKGILVHDHETLLYHYGIGHAECNAHILRYLKKNSEDTRNSWSNRLAELFCEMNKARKSIMEMGKTAFDAGEIEVFMKRYDAILNEGFEQNKKTLCKWAKKEEAALIRRLIKFKDSHLLFLSRFDVDFTNNKSERDLRKCKLKMKISGAFRSFQGCSDFCAILSILETARRRRDYLSLPE